MYNAHLFNFQAGQWVLVVHYILCIDSEKMIRNMHVTCLAVHDHNILCDQVIGAPIENIAFLLNALL